MRATAVVKPRNVPAEMRKFYRQPANAPTVEYSVTIEWDAPVDRKNTGGWVVNTAKNAQRLARCINDQKAFKVNGNGQGDILTDIDGKTYVNWQGLVYGKRLNSDLKKLGY